MSVENQLYLMSQNLKAAYESIEQIGGYLPDCLNFENLCISILSTNIDDSETTNYTQQDIDQSQGTIIPIGKTNPLYVVAILDNDGQDCDIYRNTSDSDGIVAQYNITDNLSPLSRSSIIKNVTYHTGVFTTGDYLFYKSNSIISIEFSNTVTAISEGTFYDVSDPVISRIVIPSTVRFIKPKAFLRTSVGEIVYEDQAKLVECHSDSIACLPDYPSSSYPTRYTGTVVYPDCVSGTISIPQHSHASGLYIGKNVTGIQEGSYFGMYKSSGIGQLVLPNGLKEFGNPNTGYSGPFNHARYFTNTSLTLPDSLQKVGMDHFLYDCATFTLESVSISQDNEYFSTQDGVLFNKNKTKLLFYPPMKSDKYYEMPDTVSSMGELCFSRNKKIERLRLSDNYVIVIKRGLNPGSSLNDGLYNQLTSLTEIVVGENNTRYTAKNGCVYSKNEKIFYYSPPGQREVYIADGTQKIEMDVFGPVSSQSVYFTSEYGYLRVVVHIPSTVNSIDDEYLTGSQVKYFDFYVDENNEKYTTEEVSDSHGTYHKLIRK